MSYKSELVAGFWQYVTSRTDLVERLDRADVGTRPPVFTPKNADLNVICVPHESPERKARLLGTLPAGSRHRWFRSMTSSQALAQSLFGNLIVHDQLGVLGAVQTEAGEPLVGAAPETAELESKVVSLREPRKSSLDVLIRSANGYRVAFECKLTEPEVGACSRPALTPRDSNYERDHCDGTYTCQRGRRERCSLSEIGVAYWDHIPHLFHWSADRDHTPCPVRETYQLVRNILAVSVDDEGVLDPGRGHVVLIYDERNPAFVSGGAGRRAYEQTGEALRERSTLRRCSWQSILQHLRSAGVLAWLTDELSAKYGL
ncbi:MAG: hypothetical protein JXA57_13835 [Armatimonadetes bacterium]|nr:hypothetical protein [Armatimonadota bacterium]